MSAPLMYAVQPTDVVVCLRSGVWNLTNGVRETPPSRINRAIIRGLLQAAIEQLDEMDEAKR